MSTAGGGSATESNYRYPQAQGNQWISVGIEAL